MIFIAVVNYVLKLQFLHLYDYVLLLNTDLTYDVDLHVERINCIVYYCLSCMQLKDIIDV